ncbi:myosin-2-like, partial [Pararge aegeria]
MMPTMLTRRAAALQEQLKLKNALSELKSLKQLNADLMREQDDSEVEMRSIIAKNSQLKGELADLHSAHTLVLEERNQLQEAVRSFNQCISTYDEALGRITMLEGELCSAHKTIDDLQSQLQNVEMQSTNNLYDELLTSSSTMPVCIDLTCDSPCVKKTKPQIDLPFLNSHNKIKKYIRISKIIKKTQKLVKNQKKSSENLILRKERSVLLNKLNTFSLSFQSSREKYESEIQTLNDVIQQLEDSLKTMTIKYELSKKQIDEQILAADELLALGTYNRARFESLANKCQ